MRWIDTPQTQKTIISFPFLSSRSWRRETHTRSCLCPFRRIRQWMHTIAYIRREREERGALLSSCIAYSKWAGAKCQVRREKWYVLRMDLVGLQHPPPFSPRASSRRATAKGKGSYNGSPPQYLLEETPAPFLNPSLTTCSSDAAVNLRAAHPFCYSSTSYSSRYDSLRISPSLLLACESWFSSCRISTCSTNTLAQCPPTTIIFRGKRKHTCCSICLTLNS